MLRKCISENTKYLLLLFCAVYMNVSHSATTASDVYSIVLASTPGTGNHWRPKDSRLIADHTIYVTQTMVKGSIWERLNLGFFKSRKEAAAYAQKLQSLYPGTWVNKVSSDEVTLATKTAIALPSIANASAANTPTTRSTSGLSDEQLDSMMQRARAEFTNKDYKQAIRYFSAIVSVGESKYSREALELLGLSRYRNGQQAHAVAIYKKYIALYPTGEATERVKQRLAGLLTETAEPKDKLQMTAARPEAESETYGSVSQFYSNNVTTTSDAGSFQTLSRLLTFFDVTNITKSSNYEHRLQFTADDSYDFLNTGNKNEFRFIEMYYDIASRNTGTSARIGRQKLRIGGLLNRFDGASVGYQITRDLRVSLLGGRPVETDDKSTINTHKKFYGGVIETGTFLDHWNMSLYHFKQTVDGIDDHISTGTEVRYRDKSLSAIGLIDYDSLFKVVNLAQFNANILMTGGRSAYMSAFWRKTPVLSASNALIGRTETSIDELLKTLNIEQVYQLARDRSANSQTITLGGSKPLNEKFQVSTDITLSKIGSTAGSGGVPATESTGTDYYLGAQLVTSGLITGKDTTVFGTRYLSTKISDTLSLIVNTRIPIGREWRVNPRLQYDMRKLSDGRRQNKIRALLRTNYRYQRNARFDFEIGYDNTNETSSATADNSSNNLFYDLGYRYDF
jgi:tetratricopeptide (TPR) repeat protein